MSHLNSNLLRRIHWLEGQLAERDRKDAVAQAAAADVLAKVAADKSAEDRAAAKLAEAQGIRRNAWVLHIIEQGATFDVDAIEAAIPDDPAAFPPGFDPSLVAFAATKIPPPKSVETTTLGKLQKGTTL